MSGFRPLPSPDTAQQLERARIKLQVANAKYQYEKLTRLEVGDQVRLTGGRFAGSIATVRTIDVKGWKIWADISTFGLTDVEIKVDQFELL